MAHGQEGPARPPGPEGAPRAPSRGPGPALLRESLDNTEDPELGQHGRSRHGNYPGKMNGNGPFGMAFFNGGADSGAKKSTRKPNFGTFGPIIYILSRNIKP